MPESLLGQHLTPIFPVVTAAAAAAAAGSDRQSGRSRHGAQWTKMAALISASPKTTVVVGRSRARASVAAVAAAGSG